MDIITVLFSAAAALAAVVAAVFSARAARDEKDGSTDDQRLDSVLASLDHLAARSEATQQTLVAQATAAEERKKALEGRIELASRKVDDARRELADKLMEGQNATRQALDTSRRETKDALEKGQTGLNQRLAEVRSVVDDKLASTLSRQSGELRDQLGKFDQRFSGFQTQIQGFQEQIKGGLSEVRTTVERQLGSIREDNNKQLDRMRATVDEKLTNTLNSRLNASFKQVSDQLESVYKGLGDMRSIATGVGDLKRVLSGVKTRGILGEVQLGAILADILTTDQYEREVVTKPGSTERVEFAVKIPVEDGDPVLLPIDSKFPGTTYEHLRDALDSGDADAAEKARKNLETTIKSEAKDIHDKYISVPATTNFAIMFLPFEGLYAEVVDRPGLIERLQRDYQVNVAGPSTMAAILNSLQMSYQTFALQRRADEIQQILAAVKAEFPKYQKELETALKQINRAGDTVNKIITTRTNVISRKLKDVTALEDASQAEHLLGIDNVPVEARIETVDDDSDEE